MSKQTISSPNFRSLRRNSFTFKRAYLETMLDLFVTDQDRYVFLLELIERGLNGRLEYLTKPGASDNWADNYK